MRKSIYFSAAVFFSITILFVLSCSKEETKSETENQPAQITYEQQVIKAIQSFKEKVAYHRENPGYKSGESLPADSAIWLIEATISYSHAFPNEYYGGFESDTLILNLARNAEGKVDLFELTNKYEEMKQAVAEVYHNSGFIEKGLAVVDLSETSGTEDEIELNIQVLTGDKGNEPPPPVPVEGPFNKGDNWYYGENAGKCEDATTDEFDAAQRLYAEASATIPDPNGNYGFVGPFFEPDIIGGENDFLYPYDPTPGDNHLDYYLFYATTEIGVCGDDTLCLEWPEMNSYFVRLLYLMNHYYLDNPYFIGYDIVCITEFDDYQEMYTNNFIDYYIRYYHKGKLKFGKKIYRDDVTPQEL